MILSPEDTEINLSKDNAFFYLPTDFTDDFFLKPGSEIQTAVENVNFFDRFV